MTAVTAMGAPRPVVVRLALPERRRLAFTLDGQPCEGFEGDTVLTAVLALADHVRLHEASGAPHAGLCGIGACQDCWMRCADGRRLRACTTPLDAGMALVRGFDVSGLDSSSFDPTALDSTGLDPTSLNP